MAKVASWYEEYQYYIITLRSLSHQDLLLPVVFTELLRRTFLFTLEHAVEVGKIVESALVAYLGNRTCGVNQQPGGESQTEIGRAHV